MVSEVGTELLLFLHLSLMGSVRYQPSQVWKMLVLLPAEAVERRQQFIQFPGGFAFSDRHLFCNSIFNCSNPYNDFIICSPEKRNGDVFCVWVVCFGLFLSPGLGNGCRMKFYQEQYETREEFLETQRFMYVLQALSLMLFIRKGHSMAKMLFSFSPELARAPGT